MFKVRVAGSLAALALSGCLILSGCSAPWNKTDNSHQGEASAQDSSWEEAPEEEATEGKTVSSSEEDSVADTAKETAVSSSAENAAADAAKETTADSSAENRESDLQREDCDPVDTTPQPVSFQEDWEFGANSMIHTGQAVLYRAAENRKNLVIGVNAGHGCEGGSSVRTYCHPDQTPKITGGSTAEGQVTATACDTGMDFYDGTPEREVTLAQARILKEMLLERGYDVLMLRDQEDVQLDNIARTLICNAYADCHIAIHWDGDGLDYDKGCYYMSVPDGLKTMYPVSEAWEKSDHLGECLISGLRESGALIFESGSMQMDLTQTSYSKIPSVDIELGNAVSDHSPETLEALAGGLVAGIEAFF
ncbi:MAG: N-acetylmuramoyl-L-alanine amidase [Lachnospiraceae bacterium]|nr:N-acetylmuramoyl-L-alanine amidase [Lachnospiraceae bacterium]